MSMTKPPSQPALDSVAAIEQACQALHRTRRLRTCTWSLLFVLAVGLSCVIGEVSLSQFIEGLPGAYHYLQSLAPVLHSRTLLTDLSTWYWGLGKWLRLLGDTIVMAFLGTVLGACGACVLSFPASRNLVGSTLLYLSSRRVLDIARAVPELVYALLFVFAFGLGPLPGVLAMAVHSTGALGKLFSEMNESLDMRTLEGVQSTGAHWPQVLRYAVLPQVLPGFLSYILLRFEINVRAASVIGFVGAGGIGQELMFVIRQFIYTDVSAMVLLIILTVALIDLTCERWRHRALGSGASL